MAQYYATREQHVYPGRTNMPSKMQWNQKKYQSALKNHEFVYVGGKSSGTNTRKITGAVHGWQCEGDIPKTNSMVFCPRWRICGTARDVMMALEELSKAEVEYAMANTITKYNMSNPYYYMFAKEIEDYNRFLQEKQINNRNLVNEGRFIVENLDHAYVINRDNIYQFRLLDQVVISLSHRRKTQPILEVAPQYQVPHVVPMSPYVAEQAYPTTTHYLAPSTTPAPAILAAPGSPGAAQWEGSGIGPQLISTPMTRHDI